MEYRQFGRTDMKVSAIGFGCWEISGTYGPIDAAQFDQAVHRALDAGINCFDTAEAYGMGISEQALGRALGARRRTSAWSPRSASATRRHPTAATAAARGSWPRSSRA